MNGMKEILAILRKMDTENIITKINRFIAENGFKDKGMGKDK